MQMLKRMYAKLTSHALAPTPTRVDARDCGLSFEQVADTRAHLKRANIGFSCFLCHHSTNQTKKNIHYSHEGADVFLGGMHQQHYITNTKLLVASAYNPYQHIAQGFTILCLINFTTILEGGLIYLWSITFHQLSLLTILAMHWICLPVSETRPLGTLWRAFQC